MYLINVSFGNYSPRIADTSTTSLASVTQKELQIGERVIVSSSQGSKTGILRYMGSTEFAPGEWCGVELDEGTGKNDGAVGDKRCLSDSSCSSFTLPAWLLRVRFDFRDDSDDDERICFVREEDDYFPRPLMEFGLVQLYYRKNLPESFAKELQLIFQYF